MHQVDLLRSDESVQLFLKGWKFWMVLDAVQRRVIARVALVFPDMDESFAVANFRPPASHQMHFLGRIVGHPRIPTADQLDIIVDFVRLNIVEDDGMNIFASS